MARSTKPEQTKLAICVLAPTSPLILDLHHKSLQRPRADPGGKKGGRGFTYLVMDPAAGKVPGTNDPARFATPKATSSLFGLIVCENLAAFCFADTMLSKNPITDANLVPTC